MLQLVRSLVVVVVTFAVVAAEVVELFDAAGLEVVAVVRFEAKAKVDPAIPEVEYLRL